MLGAILGGIGSIASSIIGKSQADEQMDAQKDFAKKGIQWKVADAVKAGLHPLAALGANTMSYSPVSVGVPDLGAMGQDVGRAIQATQNGTERATGQLGLLQLERAGLENDLLRTQIASENTRLAGQLGPPMPTDGGLKMGGHHIITDPSTDDAQKYEDRYGEALGSVAGAAVAWQDLKKNVGSMTPAQILRAVDNITKIPATQYDWRKRQPHDGSGESW